MKLFKKNFLIITTLLFAGYLVSCKPNVSVKPKEEQKEQENVTYKVYYRKNQNNPADDMLIHPGISLEEYEIGKKDFSENDYIDASESGYIVILSEDGMDTFIEILNRNNLARSDYYIVGYDSDGNLKVHELMHETIYQNFTSYFKYSESVYTTTCNNLIIVLSVDAITNNLLNKFYRYFYSSFDDDNELD